MKKKIVSLVFMIICYALATGYSLIILFTSFVNKPIKEKDVVSYQGTVVYVSANAGDENHLCKIKLKEFNAELMIFNQESILDINKFNNLKEDDVVEFSIAKNDIKTLNENFYVDIISLKFSDEYIVTLESYNLTLLQDIRFISMVGTSTVLVFFSLGIVFNNIYRKQKLLLKYKEQQRQSQPAEE